MSAPPPTLRQILVRSKRAASYTLDDMAADAVGLLDALGIDAAHVVGASMGGMIAQTIAARYPQRTLSLTSIMSNTGSRLSGQPAANVLPLFLKSPPRGRDAYVERTIKLFGVIGSPGFERDERELREMLERGWERGHDAAGPGRQLAAVLAAPDRRKLLGRITAPTLVIHGKADRLVRPSGGRATARAIPGARLLLIDGMGHDLPRGAWPQILDAIEATARSAAGPRQRSPRTGSLAGVGSAWRVGGRSSTASEGRGTRDVEELPAHGRGQGSGHDAGRRGRGDRHVVCL